MTSALNIFFIFFLQKDLGSYLRKMQVNDSEI